MSRPIYEITQEIKRDWKNVSPYAKPYLNAMCTMNSIDGMYFEDSCKSVVLYFLSNAASWKGEVARRIKAELKEMTK